MRNFFLSIFILFTINSASAQVDANDFSKYTFSEESDYKAAEPDVLKTANLLLNSDITKAELTRLNATMFIINWMQGTPDYLFNIDDNVNLLGNDPVIGGLYYAASVKYVLENPANAKDKDAVKIGTWTNVANYVAKPEHNVKLTRKLKKLIEANSNGTLSTFLK